MNKEKDHHHAIPLTASAMSKYQMVGEIIRFVEEVALSVMRFTLSVEIIERSFIL